MGFNSFEVSTNVWGSIHKSQLGRRIITYNLKVNTHISTEQ
jgi:hypothetical protein